MFDGKESVGANIYGCVYVWTEDDIPCYVGMTTGRIHTRIAQHLRKVDDNPLHSKLKTDCSRFKCYWILESDDRVRLIVEEIRYIMELDTFVGDNQSGYNLTRGGDAAEGLDWLIDAIRKAAKYGVWVTGFPNTSGLTSPHPFFSDDSTMTKRCFSYIRFSSRQQERGQSLARQTAMANEWCAKNDGVLDTSLNMHDLGVSAYKGANLEDTAALGGFLKAVNEGRIPKGSYFLIENFDRLTRRQTDEAYQIFRQILLADVNIVTLGDNRTYTKESLNNFTDIIISIITMSRAHEEVARKAELLKKKWEERRKNIKTKKIATKYPSWLTLSKDYTTFTEIPEAVAIIKQIFTDYINGVGVVTIAGNLNKAGIPCISKRSAIWKTHYIQQLLRSRALIGEYQPHKRGVNGEKVIAGKLETEYYPKVIDLETFNKVQYLLGKIPPKTDNYNDYGVNLFTGKLWCPYCGEKMFIAYHQVSKTLKDGTKKQYKKLQSLTCVSAKNGKCLNLSWSLPDFEKKFLECSTELQAAFSIDNNDKTKIEEALGIIQTNILNKQKTIAKYQKAFEDDSAPEGAMQRWKELETEVVDLKKQLENKRNELTSIGEGNPYKNLATLNVLNNADRVKLYSIIKTTIDKIYVFFAGTKFAYAKAVSAQLRLKRENVNPTKIAYVIRDQLKIEESRFFVAHLNVPGKDRRLVYPRYEASLQDVE